MCNNGLLNGRFLLRGEYSMVNVAILVVPWPAVVVNDLYLVPFVNPLSAVTNVHGER
jgi:hypothetical protein